jgi:hypothetical protein
MNGKAQSEQMFSGLASRPDIQLRDCHFGSGPEPDLFCTTEMLMWKGLIREYRRSLALQADMDFCQCLNP